MTRWQALPTFPTGTFGTDMLAGKGSVASNGWFMLSSTATPTQFKCVDGENHKDGSWSAKLQIDKNQDGYEGYYLDSKDGWLCPVSSTSERWHFIVINYSSYEMWQVSTKRPVRYDEKKSGDDHYARCNGTTPHWVRVTRW